MKTANLAIAFTDIQGFTERTSRQTLEQNERLLKTHSDLLRGSALDRELDALAKAPLEELMAKEEPSARAYYEGRLDEALGGPARATSAYAREPRS